MERVLSDLIGSGFGSGVPPPTRSSVVSGLLGQLDNQIHNLNDTGGASHTTNTGHPDHRGVRVAGISDPNTNHNGIRATRHNNSRNQPINHPGTNASNAGSNAGARLEEAFFRNSGMRPPLLRASPIQFQQRNPSHLPRLTLLSHPVRLSSLFDQIQHSSALDDENSGFDEWSANDAVNSLSNRSNNRSDTTNQDPLNKLFGRVFGDLSRAVDNELSELRSELRHEDLGDAVRIRKNFNL
jgi:hypothetical protein